MKKKYQNIFFIFGIAVLVVMVTQLDFQQVWQGLSHAGYWFVAVLVLWIFLYIYLIPRHGILSSMLVESRR